MEKISKYLYTANYKNKKILYHPISNEFFCMKDDEYYNFYEMIEDIEVFKVKFPTFYNWLKDNYFIVPNQNLELNILKTQNKIKRFSDKDYWLTINPTLECNLDCWYCTVKEATNGKIFNGRVSDKLLLSMKKHIKYMIEVEKITSLRLDWFGGEPLLYFKEVILPLTTYAIEITKENNIPLINFITTNATLVSKQIAQQFNILQISNFQITIDGIQEQHDKIKFFKNKKNSAFNTTIKNILLILQTNSKANVNLRINYDKDTLTRIFDVLTSINIEYRNRINVDYHLIFQLEKIEKLDINNIIKKTQDLGFNSSYWAFRPQRFYTCYADKYYHAAINYDGKVFKCTARDYTDKHQVGVLKETGIIEYNEKLYEMHAIANFENEECINCKYLPLCFGPCIQFAYDKKNSIKEICSKKNWEISVNDFVISKYQMLQDA